MKSQIRTRLLSGSGHALLLSLLLAPMAKAEVAATPGPANVPGERRRPDLGRRRRRRRCGRISGGRHRQEIRQPVAGDGGGHGGPALGRPRGRSSRASWGRGPCWRPRSRSMRSQPPRSRTLQVNDINGIFRNDASVTQLNSGTSQASGAQFTVRGIAVDHLLGYKNGRPGHSVLVDRLSDRTLRFGAVAQGVRAASCTASERPGGVVNFTLQASDGLSLLSVDAGVRSDSLFSQHVDFGGPIIADKLGFRINDIHESGDTFNGGHNGGNSFTVAIDAKPTDRLTWTFDSLYMRTRQTDEINTMSVAPSVTHLDPISGRTPLGAVGDWKTNSSIRCDRPGVDHQRRLEARRQRSLRPPEREFPGQPDPDHQQQGRRQPLRLLHPAGVQFLADPGRPERQVQHRTPGPQPDRRRQLATDQLL